MDYEFMWKILKIQIGNYIRYYEEHKDSEKYGHDNQVSLQVCNSILGKMQEFENVKE